MTKTINHKKLFYELFKKLIIFFIFLSISYSVSYQQFKHFDVDDPRGLSDAKSYLEMSNNNYYVPKTHRYRFLIPKTVEFLRPYIGHINTFSIDNKETKKIENDKIIFYLINLIIVSLTTYFLFIFMQLINFNIYESFIGGILFVTSRGIIAITGSPMIDSLQYLGIIIYCILITKDQINKLAIFSPFLILTKETMIPVLIFPLIRRKTKRLKYFFGLIISFIVLVISRNNIYSSLDPNQIPLEFNEVNIFQNIYQHSLRFGYNLSKLFTLKGFHTLFYTYGIFLIASFLGYFIFKKNKEINMPTIIKLLLPYSIVLGFISRDIGRMLLISFPVIIPYAVLTISKTFEYVKKNS